MFKQRFCEWDALQFDPTKLNFSIFWMRCKKTSKAAFGSEAQTFINKAIYAKMPDHVKKILNSAYLEDKPYNDIFLHLKQKMRLNGVRAPDETTVVPLNAVDVHPTEQKKEQNQHGYCFRCGSYGHKKAQCRKLKKNRFYETETKTAKQTLKIPKNQNVNCLEKCT